MQDDRTWRWASNPTNYDGSSDFDTPHATSDRSINDQDLEVWASGVKLDPVIKTVIPKDDVFNPIRDLQTASRTFPSWLKDPESPNFNCLGPAQIPWKNRLCSSLQLERPWYIFSDENDPALPSAIPVILQACRHHERLWSIKGYGLGSDLDARAHLDALLSHCCEVDGDGLVRYSMGRELRLPKSTIETVEIANTRADGIMFRHMVEFIPFMSDCRFRVAVSAFRADKIIEDLVVVHCVTSYSPKGSGENRMKMAMVSALHQKKVLGLQGQFVFGIYQAVEGFLDVVAGIWQDGEIKLYEVGSYGLVVPDFLIGFYLVLRGIKRLADTYGDQLTESCWTLSAAIHANPPIDEWAQCCTRESRGISKKLANLDQWDVDDRIDAFREGIRDCESSRLSTEDAGGPEDVEFSE